MFPNILSIASSDRIALPREDVSFTPMLARDLASAIGYQAVNKFKQLVPTDPEADISVLCTSLSPDGDKLALGMNDTSVHIWDVNTGYPVFVLAAHIGPVKAVCFGENNIVSGDAYGVVYLWSSSTGACLSKPVHLPFGRDSSISCVVLSPKGSSFAYCSADNTVGVYDIEKGESLGFQFGTCDYWV